MEWGYCDLQSAPFSINAAKFLALGFNDQLESHVHSHTSYNGQKLLCSDWLVLGHKPPPHSKEIDPAAPKPPGRRVRNGWFYRENWVAVTWKRTMVARQPSLKCWRHYWWEKWRHGKGNKRKGAIYHYNKVASRFPTIYGTPVLPISHNFPPTPFAPDLPKQLGSVMHPGLCMSCSSVWNVDPP